MKLCLVCTQSSANDAATCAFCGEASWGESVPEGGDAPAVVANDAASDAAPRSRARAKSAPKGGDAS